MSKMIVLEGISCSGKTSVLHKIVEAGGQLVAENGTLSADFPPLPTNYEESRRNERIILPLEDKRCQVAREMQKDAYLDRMLLSSLAISYAWNYGSFDEFIEDVIDYIGEVDHLFLSDYTVLLEADLDTINKRNAQRPRLLDDIWVGETEIRRQKEFYEVYAGLAQSENWHIIKTDDRSLDSIVEEIVNLSYVKKEVTRNQRINEFLRLKDLLK